jgi:hypothetical protein
MTLNKIDKASDPFVFSISEAKKYGGNSKSGEIYLGFFLGECDRRLTFAARELELMADGKNSMSESTLSMALAMRAEVRLIAYTINGCIEWYRKKPRISQPFIKLLSQHSQTIDQAEKDYLFLMGMFN